MRIVVVGGTGLIGDKVMTALSRAGHHPIAASPAFGIDAFTGEGLDDAMAGADVVVDVSNAPDWSDARVLRFFETVTRNGLSAGRRAGARHHVALSVVGCERLPESGYMRAKVAQERLIRAAQVPFTIVRSTQFMEFLAHIASARTEGDVIRVPDAEVQPVAAIDAARLVAAAATGPPANGRIEIAGPEVFAFQDAIAHVLAATPAPRCAVADSNARYFGALVRRRALLPRSDARIATTRLADWVTAQPAGGRVARPAVSR